MLMQMTTSIPRWCTKVQTPHYAQFYLSSKIPTETKLPPCAQLNCALHNCAGKENRAPGVCEPRFDSCVPNLKIYGSRWYKRYQKMYLIYRMIHVANLVTLFDQRVSIILCKMIWHIDGPHNVVRYWKLWRAVVYARDWSLVNYRTCGEHSCPHL